MYGGIVVVASQSTVLKAGSACVEPTQALQQGNSKLAPISR